MSLLVIRVPPHSSGEHFLCMYGPSLTFSLPFFFAGAHLEAWEGIWWFDGHIILQIAMSPFKVIGMSCASKGLTLDSE
jgi:hypothetical protein